MAQRIKSLATEHRDPSWVPQDLHVVGVNQSHKLDSDFHCDACMCTHKINKHFSS